MGSHPSSRRAQASTSSTREGIASSDDREGRLHIHSHFRREKERSLLFAGEKKQSSSLGERGKKGRSEAPFSRATKKSSNPHLGREKDEGRRPSRLVKKGGGREEILYRCQKEEKGG